MTSTVTATTAVVSIKGAASSTVLIATTTTVTNAVLTLVGAGTNRVEAGLVQAAVQTKDNSGDYRLGNDLQCTGARFTQSTVQGGKVNLDGVQFNAPVTPGKQSIVAGVRGGSLLSSNQFNGPALFISETVTSTTIQVFMCSGTCQLVGSSTITTCNCNFTITSNQLTPPPFRTGGLGCGTGYAFSSQKTELQAAGSIVSIYGTYAGAVAIQAGDTLGLDLARPANIATLTLTGAVTFAVISMNSPTSTPPAATQCIWSAGAVLSLSSDLNPSTARTVFKCGATSTGTPSFASPIYTCGLCTCTITYSSNALIVTPTCTTTSPVSSVFIAPSATVVVVSPTTTTTTAKSSDIAWIAGPIVGGVVGALLIAGLVAYFLMKPSGEEGLEVAKGDPFNELVVEQPGAQPPAYYTHPSPNVSPYAPQYAGHNYV